MEIKKIRLIDAPKEEISLTDSEMSSLLGGNAYYCPGTYKEGGWFEDNTCSNNYSSGSCGDASNYCGSYTSCIMNLN